MIKIKSLGPAVSCILDGGCRQSNVGEGYTELEYIENTSTAFIKTGINPTIDTEMEFTGMGFSETSAQLMVAMTDTNNNFRIVKFGATSEIGGTLNTTGLPNSGVNGVSEFTAKINKEGVWVNGTKIGSFSDTALNDVGIIEILSGSYANTRYYGVGKCKRAIIRQNGIDVFYGIPAKRNSDNKVGLYDKVTGRFISSFSSVSFVAGSEVTSPTPSHPIDIVCNNGVIKASKNLFDKNNLPARIYAYFASSGTTWSYAATGYSLRFPCLPNTTYTARYNGNQTQAVLSFASTDSDNIPTPRNNSVTVTQAIRQNNPTINTPITITTGANDKWLIVQYNINEPQNTDMANNLQIELGSTATSYMPYGIYTDGTQEVVTDSLGNTASAERLLAVGNYKDTQEILSGNVIRQIGIKVLDGTESFSTSTAYGKACYITNAGVIWGANINVAPICTHFLGVLKTSNTLKPNYTCFFNENGHFYFRLEDNTVATFKQYLADQYNAGTPVIIVYPLATATTSSVTPQVLVKAPVTQTAGSISNLGITTGASTGMVNINKIYLGNNLINRIE